MELQKDSLMVVLVFGAAEGKEHGPDYNRRRLALHTVLGVEAAQALLHINLLLLVQMVSAS